LAAAWRRRRCAAWWHALVISATILPATVAAQGADELASTIEQSLAGIEFRLDTRPAQAAQDLEEQQRRLKLLEEQAPDHPALAQLRQKVEQLQASVATRLAAAGSDAAESEEASGLAPDSFEVGLQAVSNLQDHAEAELSRGRVEEAAAYLEEAEVQMDRLEARHDGEIPPDHVPLMVARERLTILKDQISDAEPAK
jgi:hypothetical protein